MKILNLIHLNFQIKLGESGLLEELAHILIQLAGKVFNKLFKLNEILLVQ